MNNAAHDDEAERAVLGAILVENGADAPELLTAGEFYREENRPIFDAILALVAVGVVPEPVAVGQQLDAAGQLERVGGVSYLSELTDGLADVANIGHYARIVRKLAAGRRAVKVAQGIETADDIEPAIAALVPLADRVATTRRGPERILVGELETRDIPPPSPVVEPVIFTDEIVQVVAFRGTGKTYLGLTLAVAIAAGVDPLAGWSVPTPRPTLYIDGEMPLVRLRGRIVDVARGLGVDLGGLPMSVMSKTSPANRGRFSSLSTIEGRAALTAAVNEVADENGGTMPVMFLDSLATLTDGADENSRESFQPVGEWMTELRGRGVVVVFFHHTGWGQEHGRGTSAHEDTIDTSLRLRAPGDRAAFDGARFEVVFDKSRNLGPGQTDGFELTLEAGTGGGVVFARSGVGERREGDLWASVICELSFESLSFNKLHKAVGGNRSVLSRLVQEKLESGDLKSDGDGNRRTLVLGSSHAPPPGTTWEPLGEPLGVVPGETQREPGGNHPGTTREPPREPAPAAGSSQPLEKGLGTTHATEGLQTVPADLEKLPAEVRERAAEFEQSGMKRAAAIGRATAEAEARDGDR